MVKFLNKDIGANPSFTLRIEEDDSAPKVGTVLKRGDDKRFLVLTLIGPTGFSSGPKVKTVMEGIDDNFARSGKIDIRDVKNQCDGFFIFTVRYLTGTKATKEKPKGVSSVNANKMEWEVVKAEEYETDYAVGFLTNLLRPTGHTTNKLYRVMPKNDKSSDQQVHVEQIAMFQIYALLGYLDSLTGGNNAPLFEKDKLSVTGEVYFDGIGQDGKPLQNACNACKGVKATVLKADKRIKEVALVKN